MSSATLPAQNHVHINHQNTLIEGSFLIDVSLPGGFGKNLSLHNQNSLIEADVWVKGKAERCDIEAVNQNSWVKLCVCERQDPVSLNILAKTKNSNVTCMIPSDFEGHLTIVNQNGHVELSHSLRERARIISDNGRVRKYLIGSEFIGSEAGDTTGDVCHVETQNGNAYVGFWEGGLEMAAKDDKAVKAVTSVPPPYSLISAPRLLAPSMSPSTMPGQNHVHIRRPNKPIHGTFLIDVSLPGGFGPNLSLESQNSTVDASVWVKGEGKRCELEAISQNSTVNLRVAERAMPVPLHILAKSKNSTVNCMIPIDFEGALTIVYKNSTVSLLPSLAAKARLMSDVGGVQKYWIGWSSDAQEEAEWMGDNCYCESMNGPVHVGYYGELAVHQEEEQTCGGLWSFFCS